MIKIHCGSCNNEFAQAESKEVIGSILDTVKLCPICGEDYVSKHSQVPYMDADNKVYLADYEHPKTSEPVKEKKSFGTMTFNKSKPTGKKR